MNRPSIRPVLISIISLLLPNLWFPHILQVIKRLLHIVIHVRHARDLSILLVNFSCNTFIKQNSIKYSYADETIVSRT